MVDVAYHKGGFQGAGSTLIPSEESLSRTRGVPGRRGWLRKGERFLNYFLFSPQNVRSGTLGRGEVLGQPLIKCIYPRRPKYCLLAKNNLFPGNSCFIWGTRTKPGISMSLYSSGPGPTHSRNTGNCTSMVIVGTFSGRRA